MIFLQAYSSPTDFCPQEFHIQLIEQDEHSHIGARFVCLGVGVSTQGWFLSKHKEFL